MAVGLNSMLLGGECFILDRIELSQSFTSIVAGRDNAASAVAASPINANFFQNSGYKYQSPNGAAAAGRSRMFRPREWMPWSLLAAGAIIVMYTSAHARKPA